jgi:hypothetical protein
MPFKFGAAYGSASNFPVVDIMSQWAGYGSDFGLDPGSHGQMLQTCKNNNKMPAFYAYFIAFMGRQLWGLQDCDMPGKNLCEKGAEFIRQNRAKIVSAYANFASQAAQIIGSNRQVLWLIEPDFYQYYSDQRQENGVLSGSYMRSLFDDFALAIKKSLPNAQISWDISPWASESQMRQWWGFFRDSPNINYLHTSGGSAQPNADAIFNFPTSLTYSFMNKLTGKKIIADTGYGRRAKKKSKAQ